MGKIGLLLFALLGAIGLTGCLSLETAKSDVSGQEHVLVRDYGWRIFNAFPLFRSEITVDRVQKELFAYAQKHGKQVDNLVFTKYDTVMLNVPLIGFTIPIPYILCYRSIQLSGELK